ncbi:hypothetical protein SGRA_0284 [Saprospira grandis str. Lewin]|uniref:Uncharacterized protein n=1 Tax=Saprospira grandis (strain Lewin) TaxID=984262 RepID=H6L7J1_SAPGL|nr:hypothetical protein SGRA_0284 [Saprospira grandis str. Lewin]
MIFFGACAAASPCAATLWGSQVCSALRFFRCAQKTGSGLRPPRRIARPFGLRPWRLCRYLQPKGRSHSCWALVFLAAAA